MNDMPCDVNGKQVKVGDKVIGFGSISFQDGFEIDRNVEVTARLNKDGVLYFGGLSAKSFDKFLIQKEREK